MRTRDILLVSVFSSILTISCIATYQAVAATAALKQSLTATGMNQGDLWQAIENLVNVVNELQTDHATTKTAVDELNTLTDELHDDHATQVTFDAEVNTDGDAANADLVAIRAAIVGITAKLDADAGITDTDYASTWDPAALTNTVIAATPIATITAAKATAGPATLTEATAIDLTP